MMIASNDALKLNFIIHEPTMRIDIKGKFQQRNKKKKSMIHFKPARL